MISIFYGLSNLFFKNSLHPKLDLISLFYKINLINDKLTCPTIHLIWCYNKVE